MKKLTSDKGKSLALDIAKQEFQAYKKTLTAKPAAPPPSTAGPGSSPQHLMLCSKRLGSRSRLLVVLRPDEIEVISAVIVGGAALSGQAAEMPRAPAFTRRLKIGSGYTGCPHCQNTGFIYCNGCRTLLCWGTPPARFKCPLCGTEGIPKTGINVHFEEQNPPGFVASEAPRQLGATPLPLPLLGLKRNRGS